MVLCVLAMNVGGCRQCLDLEPGESLCPWDAGRSEVADTGCECPERNECEEFVYVFCIPLDGGGFSCEYEYRESGETEQHEGLDLLALTDVYYGCCATVGGSGIYFQ